MTVKLRWVCPKCGAKRSDTSVGLSYDGSRRLNVDVWEYCENCGHIDKYEDVRKEANENGLNRIAYSDDSKKTLQAIADAELAFYHAFTGYMHEGHAGDEPALECTRCKSYHLGTGSLCPACEDALIAENAALRAAAEDMQWSWESLINGISKDFVTVEIVLGDDTIRATRSLESMKKSMRLIKEALTAPNAAK